MSREGAIKHALLHGRWCQNSFRQSMGSSKNATAFSPRIGDAMRPAQVHVGRRSRNHLAGGVSSDDAVPVVGGGVQSNGRAKG